MASKHYNHVYILNDSSCYRRHPILEKEMMVIWTGQWHIGKKGTIQEIFRRYNQRGWELDAEKEGEK